MKKTKENDLGVDVILNDIKDNPLCIHGVYYDIV